MNRFQEFFDMYDLSNEISDICQEAKNMKFTEIEEAAQLMWQTKDKMQKVKIAAKIFEEISDEDCENYYDFRELKIEAAKIVENFRAENNN